MDYILDIVFILTTVSVLTWVCFKQSASSKFIMAVLALEIFYIFGYSVFNVGNTPYFVSAFAQLAAIAFLSLMSGGGISKIIVMFIYVIMLLCHLLFYFNMPFQARPYLDILAALSYLQMAVVLFRPKIESVFYGGRFNSYLVGRPFVGGLFRYWIDYDFQGAKKDTVK